MRACQSLRVAVSILACVAGCALAAVTASAGTEWKGREELRAGSRYVINPAEPMGTRVVLEATQLWSRGGDDDDELTIGRFGGAVVDNSGITYLLDDQTSKIHVILANGQYVRSIGGDGEAPGEFRMASGTALLSDTVLCVTQVVPARAVRISVTGRALDDYPLSSDLISSYFNGCAAVNGQLVVYNGETVQRDGGLGLRSSFVLLDATGEIATTYWEQTQTADFANMEFDEKKDAGPIWAVGSDGRLVLNNDWDSYVIECFSPSGAREHIIIREFEHLRRPRAELKRAEKMKQDGKIPADTRLSTTIRDITKLLPRRDGSVWVLSSRGERDVRDGVAAKFDVFDRSGRFAKTLWLKAPFRAGRDKFDLVDDHLFVIKNGGPEPGDDELEIMCFKLREKPN